MERFFDLILNPDQFQDRQFVLNEISGKSGIKISDIKDFRILRKSIDARKNVKFNVRVEIILHGETFKPIFGNYRFDNVENSKDIIIVGAGPAGYFAALECILQGLKPIVLERGKPVEERKKDIALLNRNISIKPESNYAFGEGGAGTYSDGKLYTRSKKRGDVNKVLSLLVQFGANPEILIDTHPHIGTDKLPQIIKNIRNQILSCGGEIHFNSKVTKIITEDNQVKGVICSDGRLFKNDKIILATGHSARDVYYFLAEQGINMTNKGFAMGVRVEHPQELINKIQYGKDYKNSYLPAASYSIAVQVENRGVYSFCMCPGGTIVNSSTQIKELVVNGMSNSKRNSPYANSGIVVEIQPEDYIKLYGNEMFAGLNMQMEFEKSAYFNAGGGFRAPAQRLKDFVNGKLSSTLPQSSYHPGLVSSPLHFWMPEFISERLRKAFVEFDKKMKNFLSNDAIVVGVESRTSSPIQITRNENFESTSVKGLFPCGEGAGYAGGIVSSAIDGIETVKIIKQVIQKD
ncbi:MAG: FAD-binding protein [Bacteroidales bacterium]|jgi:uncharacterized FAD-dependent dehydrogenase